MKIITKNGLFEYQAVNPKDLSNRKNKNHFFFKRTIWIDDAHLGEMLAWIVANKVGFEACDVELYKKQFLFNSKFDRGILSYVEKSENDNFINPYFLIKNYLKSINSNSKFERGIYDIDTILNSIFQECLKNNRPYQEFLDIKQDLINMIVFDFKFLNTDRTIDNWMLRRDTKTGVIDLYPMFDNEGVLGFDINLEKGQTFSREQIENFNRERRIAVISPSDVGKDENKVKYEEILRYLLKMYPEQTKNALEAVSKFRVSDLEQALDEIEDISEERKKLALGLFIARSRDINRIYEEKTKNEHARLKQI